MVVSVVLVLIQYAFAKAYYYTFTVLTQAHLSLTLNQFIIVPETGMKQ